MSTEADECKPKKNGTNASERLRQFLRAYVLDRMKPANAADDVVRTVDRFRSISGFSPHEFLLLQRQRGAVAEKKEEKEKEDGVEECRLLQNSCYWLHAKCLVADDAITNTNTEMSRALGPVIWE